MGVERIAYATAPAFARHLIERAETVPGVGAHQFRLPHLALTVRTRSARYAELCRRALVDDADYADGLARPITVSVLDRVTTPDLPYAHWSDATLGLGELGARIEAAGLFGSYDVDNAVWHFFDPQRGSGVQAMPRADALPPWEESFPLRTHVHWAYQSIGLQLVHAGTLGLDGSGVLLAGEGGAGKSGTTLAGLLNGLESVGDDYIVFDPRGEAPRVFPVMKLMKQDAAGLDRLGIASKGMDGPNWQNKHEFDFAAIGLGTRAKSLRLEAVLLPRIAGNATSTLAPASRREAMTALAPSNIRQLPGAWRQGFSAVAELVRRLPAFHLALGTDPAEIAGTIGGFLSRGEWSRRR